MEQLEQIEPTIISSITPNPSNIFEVIYKLFTIKDDYLRTEAAAKLTGKLDEFYQKFGRRK